MDIDRLNQIIEAENIKEFCKYFLNLKSRQITNISVNEYGEVIMLCRRLKGNKKLIQIAEFFEFLYYSGYDNLIIKDNFLLERDYEYIAVSKFYFDVFLSLYIKTDLNYARALLCKGTSLNILAEMGLRIDDNVNESMECFDKSIPIFKDRYDYIDYAGTLINKGISLQILASRGIDKKGNIIESIKCFDEAKPIFKKTKSDLIYAKMLIDQINNLKNLVRKEDIEIINICLGGSLKYINELIPILEHKEHKLDYAGWLENKGTILQFLAIHGIDEKENLNESMKCLEKAAYIFKKEESDLNYASTLLNRGNGFRLLTIYEIENHFEDMINSYIDAENIFYNNNHHLCFIYTCLNHCEVLWWKYKKTEKEIYIDQAKDIIKRALEITNLLKGGPNVLYLKDVLNNRLIQILEILVDKNNTTLKLDEILTIIKAQSSSIVDNKIELVNRIKFSSILPIPIYEGSAELKTTINLNVWIKQLKGKLFRVLKYIH